jgi:hypothetical protein
MPLARYKMKLSQVYNSVPQTTKINTLAEDDCMNMSFTIKSEVL